ncbi:hypothetical protein O6H91_Y366700 [Diphasiastrum complanatum]|nr:hypothetical protein O6H91_Y366700 [Diphasiastrum complanatum]
MRPPPASESNTRNRLFSWKEIMVTLAGFVLFLLAFATGRGRASVVLLTPKNETIAFPDTEASFAPRISGAGLFGIVFVASPLDACKPLENGPFPVQSFPIALVVRGECTFQTKVELAQNAGFAAVIVYDNEDNEDLITMSGDSTGIKIPAVFVSKAAGKILLQYVVENGTRCYILPVFENTAWSVMAVSFISLLAIFAVLAIFFVLRRHRLRQLGSRLGLTRESMSMTSKEVKALPTCIFTCIVDGKETSETCAICLEDYEIGEKLRILPCHHEFHAACIDHWLTTRRPFCPICKRDAHSKFEEPPASENTPLLTTASRGRVPAVIESHEVTQASPTGVLRADSLGSSNEDINEFFVASPVHSPCEVGSQSSNSHRYANGSPVGSPIEVQTQTSFLQTSRNSSLSKVHQQISIPQDLTNISSVKTYTCEQASESFDRPHKSSMTATVSLPCGECSSVLLLHPLLMWLVLQGDSFCPHLRLLILTLFLF